jgi:hypothetical protein
MQPAIKLLALIVATIFCIGEAFAQTVDIDKLSDADWALLTPEQTKALPAFKTFTRMQPQFGVGMRAWVPLMLRDLGYGFREAFTGSDEQLRRWVAQFQRDVGEPETGDLTYGQWETLSKRATDVIKTPHISLTGGSRTMITTDYAMAQGILEGDQQFGGEPAKTLTNFRCFREFGFCFQSDVWISSSGPILKGPSYSVLTGPVLDGPIYKFTQYEQKIPITSWKEHEVVATIKDGLCKTTTITISAREAFQIIRYDGDPTCAENKPRLDKLIDADTYSEDYFTDKQKQAEGYYSKEYREYLEATRALIVEKPKPSQAKAQTQTVPSQP